MNIHEYQAKELLGQIRRRRARGRGRLYHGRGDGRGAQARAGPVNVVKAQIHAGGRGAGRFKDDPNGKGGVRVAKSIDEVGAARRGDARP